VRNNDIELTAKSYCENISNEKETFPILNERIKLIIKEPANYKKMIL
jgi:hypothetical protein